MPVQLVDRLAGVQPALRAKVERILAAMLALGYPMFVVSGNRTLAEQQKLYAQGRTAPGKIVTNCDGVARKSNHQDGRAVDCAFVDDPLTAKIETWDEKQPWEVYGTMAEALGLTWGGRWKSPVDKPHIELRD
jgi:peptidoglycan L-alanyl-D-glutamate endopeptidase CwlK